MWFAGSAPLGNSNSFATEPTARRLADTSRITPPINLNIADPLIHLSQYWNVTIGVAVCANTDNEVASNNDSFQVQKSEFWQLNGSMHLRFMSENIVLIKSQICDYFVSCLTLFVKNNSGKRWVSCFTMFTQIKKQPCIIACSAVYMKKVREWFAPFSLPPLGVHP